MIISFVTHLNSYTQRIMVIKVQRPLATEVVGGSRWCLKQVRVVAFVNGHTGNFRPDQYACELVHDQTSQIEPQLAIHYRQVISLGEGQDDGSLAIFRRCYCMKYSECGSGVSFSNLFASSCIVSLIFRIAADSFWSCCKRRKGGCIDIYGQYNFHWCHLRVNFCSSYPLSFSYFFLKFLLGF